DPKELVSNAIQPAKSIAVIVDPKDKTAIAIVPDDQLSLAIGKKGQNARLAVQSSGWKIDIKSETDALVQDIHY
ncbi:MAG: transcription termination/antitermination protein NusA, partial [Candidatus Izemoplasmatales bacterium]